MIRAGDYGVTPGGGWPMWCVRAWTGHPPFFRPAWAGHAAIVEWSTPDTVGIIEATPNAGVRRRQVETDDPAWRWSNEALLSGQRSAIVTGAVGELGKPYDWPSVAEVGVRVAFARFKGRAADHPDDRLFCSELVAWLYRDKGHHDLFPGIAPGTVSPDALDRRRAGPLPLQPGPNA
jgi:uncharacterized protein YycO